MKPLRRDQQGFTLFELLVVVSVLAAMASIAAVAVDGYQQTAEDELAKVEIQAIASAIQRFKADTGYYPREGLFADDQLYGSNSSPEKSDYNKDENLYWLFSSPLLHDVNGDGNVNSADQSAGGPKEKMPWNESVGRGWHGPYLEIDGRRSVVVNNAVCALDHSLFDTGFDGKESVGLLDRFERRIDADSESCSALNTSSGWVKRDYSGQAYRYILKYWNDSVLNCETATVNGCLAVVSSGPDSTYSTDDDLVHVLRVNP